jgi:hypothetical protein
MAKIRINIKYRSNGLWDRVFTNPDNNRNIYTIIIISPLKKDTRWYGKRSMRGY